MISHCSFRRAAAGLFALTLTTASSAVAQIPVTPRALGMGTSYLTIARGHDALFVNPANLGLADTPRWSVLLPGLTFGGTSVGPSFEDFHDVATAEENDSDATAAFLAEIPAEGMQFDLDARPVVGIQIGSFAFGLSYGGTVRQTVGRDIAELALEGFEPGRTDYTVGNTGGWRTTHLDFAVAHARQVGPVHVGVTGHFLRGRTLARSRVYDPRFGVAGETIEIDVAEVLARGGTGFGIDVGVAATPIPRLTVGAVITNLAGTMSWSNDLIARDVTLTENDFGGEGSVEDDIADIADRFEQSERPISEASSDPRFAALASELPEGGLTRAFQAGASYAFPTSTRIAVAYRSDVDDEGIPTGGNEGVSVGLQQKLVFLSLRGGYTSNMDDRTVLSGGVSLGPVDIGIGKVTGTQGDHDRTGWMGTLGISFSGGGRR